MLDLHTHEVKLQAGILTNIPGVHALTARRQYNAGVVVEHWIAELGQLQADKTVVDDLGDIALLWDVSAFTYWTLQALRQHFLMASWCAALPERIRLWIIRFPAS